MYVPNAAAPASRTTAILPPMDLIVRVIDRADAGLEQDEDRAEVRERPRRAGRRPGPGAGGRRVCGAGVRRAERGGNERQCKSGLGRAPPEGPFTHGTDPNSRPAGGRRYLPRVRPRPWGAAATRRG